MLGNVDVQLVFYIVLALVPNLFLILWAMFRLSRDVRVVRARLDMMENDINLLDQSISSLTSEFQGIRKRESDDRAGSRRDGGATATEGK
jgi:hypothetical protein